MDDGVRILAFKEILNAKEELHVDFKADGIIPVADCGENDFIVYHLKKHSGLNLTLLMRYLLRKKKYRSIDKIRVKQYSGCRKQNKVLRIDMIMF